MRNQIQLTHDAKAWLKRKSGPDEIIHIKLEIKDNSSVTSYELYTAYEERPDYLGRILFDSKGYWIYDGEDLSVNEQEQLARFIISHTEQQ